MQHIEPIEREEKKGRQWLIIYFREFFNELLYVKRERDTLRQKDGRISKDTDDQFWH